MNIINFIVPQHFFARTGGLQNQIRFIIAELSKLGWQVTFNRNDQKLNHIFGIYDENIFSGLLLKRPCQKIFFSPIFQEKSNVITKVKYSIPKTKWARRRQLMNQSDVIFALGESEKDSISKIFGNTNIHIVPNGVCSHNFHPSAIKKKRKIIQVGVLSKRKNPNFALRIAKKLDAEIDFVGRIDQKLRLTSYQKANYIGEVHDRKRLLSLISEASVLICPSLSEGYPLVVLEALSVKTPVVVTSNSSVSSYGDIISVLPVGEIGPWCSTVEFLLKNECNENQFDQFLGPYSWANITTKLVELYVRYA